MTTFVYFLIALYLGMMMGSHGLVAPNLDFWLWYVPLWTMITYLHFKAK